MRSAFGLSGQKCSAGSTVFVHDAVADEFLATLVDKTTALKVGDPQAPDVFVGPGDQPRGGRPLRARRRQHPPAGPLRERRRDPTGGVYDKGYYVAPSIAADPPRPTTTPQGGAHSCLP
jgi:1-pyrroline-5-carboxylate dehydrogenase